MTDYSSPLYKTSLVAEAAGISHATLRSYFKRGHWRVIGKPAAGDGLPNLFSLRDAMTFAVAARLIECTSLSPGAAFNLAVENFSHIGTSDRNPGKLFDLHQRGETLLIYWPDDGTVRIVAENDISSLASIMPPSNRGHAAIVLVLNPLANQVFAHLKVSGSPWDVQHGPNETGGWVA